MCFSNTHLFSLLYLCNLLVIVSRVTYASRLPRLRNTSHSDGAVSPFFIGTLVMPTGSDDSFGLYALA